MASDCDEHGFVTSLVESAGSGVDTSWQPERSLALLTSLQGCRPVRFIAAQLGATCSMPAQASCRRSEALVFPISGRGQLVALHSKPAGQGARSGRLHACTSRSMFVAQESVRMHSEAPAAARLYPQLVEDSAWQGDLLLSGQHELYLCVCGKDLVAGERFSGLVLCGILRSGHAWLF